VAERFSTEDVLAVEMYSAHNNKISINSIKSRKEFNVIYSGVKSVSDTMVLFSSQLEKLSPCFAFVASKKVGSAVSRNRAKRRMRAALRLVLSSYSVGNSIVLVARNTILNAPFEKVLKDLKYCIKKSEKSPHLST